MQREVEYGPKYTAHFPILISKPMLIFKVKMDTLQNTHEKDPFFAIFCEEPV